MKKSILVVGDIVTMLLITIIGFASHGEEGIAFLPRMAVIFFPLTIAWLMIIPWSGLFRPEIIFNPKQLWRPAFAMIFVAPLTVVLRGLILHETIIPIFAVVLSVTSAFGMVVWRGFYILFNRE